MKPKRIFVVFILPIAIVSGMLLFTALKAEEGGANVQFTIGLAKEEFLHLETLTVTSTLTNIGQQAVEVMLPLAHEGAINFQMRRDEGEWGLPAPWGSWHSPSAPNTILQRGQSVSSEYDLWGGTYEIYEWAEFYPPATYELKALYRAKKPTITSNTLNFKIVKPQITDREYVAYRFLMRALTDPNCPANIEGNYSYEGEFLERFPRSIYANLVRLRLADGARVQEPEVCLKYALEVLENNPTDFQRNRAYGRAGGAYEEMGMYSRAIEMYRRWGSEGVLRRADELERDLKAGRIKDKSSTE